MEENCYDKQAYLLLDILCSLPGRKDCVLPIKTADISEEKHVSMFIRDVTKSFFKMCLS